MLNPRELLRMQSEAKKMQKKLQENKISGESKDGRLKIYMNGAQEYEDIYIDDELLNPDEYDSLKRCFKEAFKDYRKKLQKAMISDMDINQLKGMLGA